MPHTALGSLDLQTLAARYRNRETTPGDVLASVVARILADDDPAVFIRLLKVDEVAAQVAKVEARERAGVAQPLFGVPFAVKDNLDLAGHPTTAACPEFAYTPARSAAVVERLCAAGAIVVGKTNLDQFAAGLVGTRSPFGTPRNRFDEAYIPGGSSSGSAVAVAAGLVSFAVGTDTAGSGRVPAAFNNLVGLKPTRGMLSTAGLVPACRSLDCLSLFALTCDDAKTLFDVAAGFDAADPYSRSAAELPARAPIPAAFRFGVPGADQLEFFGNPHVARLYQAALERLRQMGGTPVTIDYAPFARAARLLYEGPWLAERLAGIKEFFARHADALLPVTRSIIGPAAGRTAIDAFEAMYELQAIRQATRPVWEAIDFLVVPSVGTIYTKAQVEAEPVRFNTNLGYYTNFVNLLDQCALALPAGFGDDGLPAGVTLVAPAGRDIDLLRIGSAYQRSTGLTLGATGHAMPTMAVAPAVIDRSIPIAVLGAHLAGQPLNSQLTDRDGRLLRVCRTAPKYRFYALAGTTPAKPGLMRVNAGETGAAIELEVWALPAEGFGTFVAAIPSPLGIGSIELEDGSWVKGFLCESHALVGARDISHTGGWRAFLKGSGS
jgi:allophanate hydrolase